MRPPVLLTSPCDDHENEEGIVTSTALSARLRVAAIPASHPYVHAVTDSSSVQLLPDPPHPGRPADQWWPPRILDAGWIGQNGDAVDVLHLHFGMESYSVPHVVRALHRARDLGMPIVHTVHDLQNPQLHDQSHHERMLDAVVGGADELIALTESVQHEIRRRWARRAAVIAHPSLMGTGPRPVGARRHGRRVGLHLRDLRPNIDGVGVVATLVRALRRAPADTTASVLMDDRVRDEDAAVAVRALCRTDRRVRLRTAPRLSDDALFAWLAGLDACILPYRHGTHSGWAELCWDLGVPVIGPPIGHFAAAHPDDFTAFVIGDAESLADAIRRATRQPAAAPGSPARKALVAGRRVVRDAQVRRVRAAHVALYRRLARREAA